MRPAAPDSPLISMVVPFLNEEAVLPRLFETLDATLPGLGSYRWELVLVDDGSTDRSVDVIRGASAGFPGDVRVVRLSRNFGHQAALMAGLGQARGEALICLDADLQDPPSLFAKFLNHYAEGHDVVYAVRQTREGSTWKRAAYWVFYRLFKSVSHIRIPLDAGDFGLVSRRVATLVTAMPERDVLVRGLRSWVGFRQIGVPYDRPERAAGETKYSLSKLLRLAASAFFGYSALPLRLATGIGLVSAMLAALYAVYAIIAKLSGHAAPAGWTSLVIVVLFLGGVQLISVGLLGEYIGRIHQQTQARPLFVVAETLEFPASETK